MTDNSIGNDNSEQTLEGSQRLLEENQRLLEENQLLVEENANLKRAARKNEREIRLTNSLLDKVAKAADAKDNLNIALADSKIKQQTYTEMLLQNCPNIIILFDDDGQFVLSTHALMTTANIPNFDYINNLNYKDVFPKYFTPDDMEAFDSAFKKVVSSNEDVRFESWVDFAQSGDPRYFSFELHHAGSKLAKDANIITDRKSVV